MPWSPQPARGLPDLIVFDGDCVLCSHWARWVHARDRGRFRFVAIQSEAGNALAARFAINASDPETNVLVLGGIAYFKFDTIVKLLTALPGWRGASLLGLAPRPLRDWAYDCIAKNRYRLFGRRDACSTPDAAMRARVLDRAMDLGPT